MRFIRIFTCCKEPETHADSEELCQLENCAPAKAWNEESAEPICVQFQKESIKLGAEPAIDVLGDLSKLSAGNEAGRIHVAPPERSGVLGPVVARLEAALILGGSGKTEDLVKEPFIQGVEAYADVLNELGGGMGSYFVANTKKLRNSLASANESMYRAWILSELPVHAHTRRESYVDESAWMANLWIAWTLEFFVELFSKIHAGIDTRPGADSVYQQTLYKHHNMVQKAAFKTALRKLPVRIKMFESLQGTAEIADVERDFARFVAVGRPIVRYCLDMNDELARTLQEARRKK